MESKHKWIICIDHPDYIEIAKLLIKKDIKGKGHFYISDIKQINNELLIACSKYGNSFVYYIVNLAKQSISLVPGRYINPPFENPAI